MKICIRKENNGSIYIDKTALTRFSEEQLKKEPYNFSFVEVDDKYKDCDGRDFNDDLTFNVEKYNTRNTTESADIIRANRETKCFAKINRGQVWYDTLTDDKNSELATWYQDWLDAPTTGVEPEDLEWL